MDKKKLKRQLLDTLLHKFGGEKILPKRTIRSLERKIEALTDQAHTMHRKATTPTSRSGRKKSMI